MDIDGIIDFVFLQESRIAPHNQTFLESFFKGEGWLLRIGYQPPIRTVDGKRSFKRQVQGGLAVLARKGAMVSNISIPDEWAQLHSSVQMVWCASKQGGFYVANCYFPSGKSNAGPRRELMSLLFEYTSTLQNSSVFLVGDFQEDPADCPPISHATLSGLWIDLYATQQSLRNQTVEASYTKTTWANGLVGPGKTRIDHVFANRKATSLFYEFRYSRSCAFPGHAPVCVSLADDVYDELILVRKLHGSFLRASPVASMNGKLGSCCACLFSRSIRTLCFPPLARVLLKQLGALLA